MWSRTVSLRGYLWKLVPGWRVERWTAGRGRTAGGASSSHLVLARCCLIGQGAGLLSVWWAAVIGRQTSPPAATGWAGCLGAPVGPGRGGCSSRAPPGREGEPPCWRWTPPHLKRIAPPRLPPPRSRPPLPPRRAGSGWGQRAGRGTWWFQRGRRTPSCCPAGDLAGLWPI